MKRSADQLFPAGHWADGENVADKASRRAARNGQPASLPPAPRPRRLVKSLVLLALVLYVGILAFRKGKGTGEDYFVASRALGPYVFLLALFGTNMTAFAILGSSGLSYQRGIGVFGLMASASAFVIPLTLCIMAIWLPCVLLGVIAAQQFPGLKPGESDEVILRLLTANTHVWLADALGAAIMACVMATDSQILALGTMFTKDIFAHYGGRKRFGERVQVWTGRAFVIAITVVAYVIALHMKDKAGIFELAIRFAFSGFAALAPVMLAALFWKRSTKWGALAATLWVLAAMLGTWYLHEASASLPGAVVKVTVEIQASVPAGVPDATLRTVSENCRTLKFTSYGFERE